MPRKKDEAKEPRTKKTSDAKPKRPTSKRGSSKAGAKAPRSSKRKRAAASAGAEHPADLSSSKGTYTLITDLEATIPVVIAPGARSPVDDIVEVLYREVIGQERAINAIARALANDPPIIAADEPTGNLDSKTAEAVFQLFGRLVDEGKTILMVTHDRDLVRRVTRTVTLADGEIVDELVRERKQTSAPSMAQESAYA